ncbi:hypothetical protein Tco_1210981 [Tanacetum coccineum]
MGAGSTSNSQFPGFSSQAPMTPEQQAFFESQQAAFAAFQQDFQNRQQNPPQFEMPQQQSQSSNSLSQTESQPKKGRMKPTAKKGKSSEPIGDVTLLWTSDEETLLAECFVAVSEDPNVGRSQPKDTLWYRYVEPSLPKVQRNLQKVQSVEKSGENEVDLMKQARGIYQDENKNSSFNHEKAWAVLRKHAKWDAPNPAPVDLTEDENVHDEHVFAVNTDELFGADPRPRPPGEAVEKAFEVSKEKDRTITRLEELRFLALSTNDLSPDDAYWI